MANISDILENAPDVLTPGQVAEIYGVRTPTVKRWAESGRLKSWRTPGGHRRFDKEVIAQAISQGFESIIESSDDRFH